MRWICYVEESEKSTKGGRAFICAMDLKKRATGLTPAECTAVTMYTCGEPADYYVEFNKDCRDGEWEKYKIFSALLFSACMKLAKIHPIDPSEVLYRGLGTKLASPSKEFFWGQFLSTTPSSNIANQFGQATKIEISQCKLGVRINKLSVFEDEQEILILPFEAFVHTETVNTIQKYKSNKTQPFNLQSVQQSQQDASPVRTIRNCKATRNATDANKDEDIDDIIHGLGRAAGISNTDAHMRKFMEEVKSKRMDEEMRGFSNKKTIRYFH